MSLKSLLRSLAGRGTTMPMMEPVYQQIVLNDLRLCGIDEHFYPVGSAANYSLFYLILRAVLDLKPQSIVELGGGQSSMLFDALSKAGRLHASIATVEHDQAWANRISALVAHPVVCVGLAERQGPAGKFRGYDFGRLPDNGPIDFLLIDGPPGYPRASRHSRFGAIDLLSRIDPKKFMIVVDDAERDGESALSKAINATLISMGLEFRRGHIRAAKTQATFCGGDYSRASYY